MSAIPDVPAIVAVLAFLLGWGIRGWLGLRQMKWLSAELDALLNRVKTWKSETDALLAQRPRLRIDGCSRCAYWMDTEKTGRVGICSVLKEQSNQLGLTDPAIWLTGPDFGCTSFSWKPDAPAEGGGP